MTSEERFERIERDLAAAAALAVRNEQAIAALAEASAAYARVNNENMTALTQRIAEYVAHAAEYVAHADARMRQMEANLDALIRIITAEHSNGQGKLGE